MTELLFDLGLVALGLALVIVAIEYRSVRQAFKGKQISSIKRSSACKVNQATGKLEDEEIVVHRVGIGPMSNVDAVDLNLRRILSQFLGCGRSRYGCGRSRECLERLAESRIDVKDFAYRDQRRL